MLQRKMHHFINLMVYAADKRGATKQLPPYCMEISTICVKRPKSISSKGSERQSIVELLLLSVVLKRVNRNIEFVVLLKASRQTYIYYTGYDA